MAAASSSSSSATASAKRFLSTDESDRPQKRSFVPTKQWCCQNRITNKCMYREKTGKEILYGRGCYSDQKVCESECRFPDFTQLEDYLYDSKVTADPTDDLKNARLYDKKRVVDARERDAIVRELNYVFDKLNGFQMETMTNAQLNDIIGALQLFGEDEFLKQIRFKPLNNFRNRFYERMDRLLVLTKDPGGMKHNMDALLMTLIDWFWQSKTDKFRQKKVRALINAIISSPNSAHVLFLLNVQLELWSYVMIYFDDIYLTDEKYKLTEETSHDLIGLLKLTKKKKKIKKDDEKNLGKNDDSKKEIESYEEMEERLEQFQTLYDPTRDEVLNLNFSSGIESEIQPFYVDKGDYIERANELSLQQIATFIDTRVSAMVTTLFANLPLNIAQEFLRLYLGTLQNMDIMDNEDSYTFFPIDVAIKTILLRLADDKAKQRDWFRVIWVTAASLPYINHTKYKPLTDAKRQELVNEFPNMAITGRSWENIFKFLQNNIMLRVDNMTRDPFFTNIYNYEPPSSSSSSLSSSSAAADSSDQKQPLLFQGFMAGISGIPIDQKSQGSAYSALTKRPVIPSSLLTATAAATNVAQAPANLLTNLLRNARDAEMGSDYKQGGGFENRQFRPRILNKYF